MNNNTYIDTTKCTHCGVKFLPTDRVCYCTVCGAYYHWDCWGKCGGCVNPACPTATVYKTATPARQSLPVCKHCGAVINDVSSASYDPAHKAYYHAQCYEKVQKANKPIDKKRCMLCKKLLSATDKVYFCKTCGAYHHANCWTTNKGCANDACSAYVAPKNAPQPTVRKDFCSLCKKAITSASDSVYCERCKAYHHVACGKISKCIAEEKKATTLASKCVACQKAFLTTDKVYFCKSCGSYHHVACWEKTKGCANPNCPDKKKVAPTAQPKVNCSLCKKEIVSKADAVYCEKCKAYHHVACSKLSKCNEPSVPKKNVDKTTCVACKKRFETTDKVYFCKVCGSYHHASCWEKTKGCANPDCTACTVAATRNVVSAVGNPVCTVCDIQIADMKDAVYCPKCRDYHHISCWGKCNK